MKINRTMKLIYAICVLLFLIFTLTPFIWGIVLSLTAETDLFVSNQKVLPDRFIFSNYQEILNPETSAHQALFTALKNSLLLSVLTVLFGVPISVLSGYTLARFPFKGRNILLSTLMLTIVIPLFTTIIPIYSIFSNFGLLDRYFWIGIIYISSFLPLNTWILMNYYRSIPKELWEAARIDGCNEWQTFRKIILPISSPIILTSILMIFLMSWNQFQIPLILINSGSKKVITLILSEFMSRDRIHYGLIAVCGVFSVIPPATIAILFRKFLISGLTAGSVKN